MRTLPRIAMMAAACVGAVVGLEGGQSPTATAAPRAVTKSEFDAWRKELSNWGRWGQDDQLGAVNLMTPTKRRQAASLVKEGVSISMARDAEKEKADDVASPYEHVMRSVGMDSLAVAYHGYAHTHLDALWHMADGDTAYNGISRAQDFKRGAPALSVHNLKTGIFTRGVLVDVPRLRGLKYLEPGTAVYPEDLDAWEKRAGIRIGSGDAVFIYTGRWARRAAVGPWNVGQSAAGLHASAARWLRQRDIAFLGHDAGNEVVPTGVEGVPFPIHQLMLVAMGVHLFDNCDLEALAVAAATRNRWDFLLTASPLPITGGTGSPLNPIATF
jgi:kynurenine formamidase